MHGGAYGCVAAHAALWAPTNAPACAPSSFSTPAAAASPLYVTTPPSSSMTEGEIIALGAELAARRGSVTTAINVLITTAHNGW